MRDERRADQRRREQAEAEVSKLKLDEKVWDKPVPAGNGRIRLKHASGAAVEGNEFTLYAVVRGAQVEAYDLSLKEAVSRVAAAKKS